MGDLHQKRAIARSWSDKGEAGVRRTEDYEADKRTVLC